MDNQGKANASHTHTVSQITNLQSTLDGKADIGYLFSEKNFSPVWNMTTNETLSYLPTLRIGEYCLLTIKNGTIKNSRNTTLFNGKIGLSVPSSGKYLIIKHINDSLFTWIDDRDEECDATLSIGNGVFDTYSFLVNSGHVNKNLPITISGTKRVLYQRLS